MIYKNLDRNKITNKFKKITAVTKTAIIIKVSTNIYNDCSIMYKHAMVLKDKPKWLAAMQDKLNSQKKQKT